MIYFFGGGAEGAFPTLGDAPFPTDTDGDAPFCVEVGELPLFSVAIYLPFLALCRKGQGLIRMLLAVSLTAPHLDFKPGTYATSGTVPMFGS